jgi:hypothetical protein
MSDVYYIRVTPDDSKVYYNRVDLTNYQRMEACVLHGSIVRVLGVWKPKINIKTVSPTY